MPLNRKPIVEPLASLRYQAKPEGQVHPGMVEAAEKVFSGIAEQAGVDEARRVFEAILAQNPA